ncbi:MAG: hypothetical protein LAP87_12120 [Acidobacteriia bacterium]|nr:hypothetical protein [Terriglobia bacterium]
MARKERIREPLDGSPTLEYLNQRMASGWKLVALEWEREAAAPAELPATHERVEEIPYGLQVSGDCQRLVENPAETQIIILALDMIVEDCPLSQVADELNRRGHRNRDGKPWTPGALFSLLPRMIDVGPRVFVSEEWVTRRKRLPRVV